MPTDTAAKATATWTYQAANRSRHWNSWPQPTKLRDRSHHCSCHVLAAITTEFIFNFFLLCFFGLFKAYMGFREEGERERESTNSTIHSATWTKFAPSDWWIWIQLLSLRSCLLTWPRSIGYLSTIRLWVGGHVDQTSLGLEILWAARFCSFLKPINVNWAWSAHEDFFWLLILFRLI